LRIRLGELGRKVQTSREAARYRDLVTLIQGMDRDFGKEANRIGMEEELGTVKANAFNGCFELTRREAQAHVRKDRFRAAQKVIDDMADELRPHAENTGLGTQLNQICEGYGCLADLAAAAGEGDAR
jgi:hypothetical protein